MRTATTSLTPFQAIWTPRALGMLRIVAGYLFTRPVAFVLSASAR